MKNNLLKVFTLSLSVLLNNSVSAKGVPNEIVQILEEWCTKKSEMLLKHIVGAHLVWEKDYIKMQEEFISMNSDTCGFHATDKRAFMNQVLFAFAFQGNDSDIKVLKRGYYAQAICSLCLRIGNNNNEYWLKDHMRKLQFLIKRSLEERVFESLVDFSKKAEEVLRFSKDYISKIDKFGREVEKDNADCINEFIRGIGGSFASALSHVVSNKEDIECFYDTKNGKKNGEMYRAPYDKNSFGIGVTDIVFAVKDNVVVTMYPKRRDNRAVTRPIILGGGATRKHSKDVIDLHDSPNSSSSQNLSIDKPFPTYPAQSISPPPHGQYTQLAHPQSAPPPAYQTQPMSPPPHVQYTQPANPQSAPPAHQMWPMSPPPYGQHMQLAYPQSAPRAYQMQSMSPPPYGQHMQLAHPQSAPRTYQMRPMSLPPYGQHMQLAYPQSAPRAYQMRPMSLPPYGQHMQLAYPQSAPRAYQMQPPRGMLADKSIYEGYLADGAPHGKGVRWYADGTVYDGNWLKGEKHGRGILWYADKGVYDGYFQKNLRHGHGKMTYPDNDVYEGNWMDDKKQGKGVYKYAFGDVYDGDWVKDEKQGKGQMTYPDGGVYIGDFSNGSQNGTGKRKWPNGSNYEGAFVDGFQDGKGKMMYSSKSIYAGGVYEGDWKVGQMTGKGKMTYSNGNAYEGDFLNNNEHGKGKITDCEGRIIYEGEFVEGKRVPLDRNVQESSSAERLCPSSERYETERKC